MKTVIVLITFFFTLVVAHDISSPIRKRHMDKKRQVLLSSTASSSGSAILQSATAIATVAPSPSSSSSSPFTASISSSLPAIGQPNGGTSTMSYLDPIITSLTLVTPMTTPLGPGTDIPPLSSITANMPPEATASLAATYVAGQTPPVNGAPPLPSPFVLTPGTWPTMDVVAPTDSPQVQTWLQQLAQSGIPIPDLQPTTDGTCASDPALAADAQNRGWWTCGGYTRSTDIVACPDKGTWGVSFDDGPSPYTQKLLNYLSDHNISATFFTVGSRVIERPQLLVEEYMTGHEISVHTWSHHPLTSLTNAQIVAELGWTKLAIQTVLGVTPTTMRPPYGDIDDRVRAISLAMGLVPIIWTRYNGQQFDTNDWRIPAGQVTGPESFQSFQYILGNSTLIDTGFIVLEHDLYQQTVDMAIGYTLPAAQNFTPTLTLEPIGECQHWPATDMYLETTTNTSFPYRNSSSSSTNSTGLIVSTATVSGQIILHTVTPTPSSKSSASAATTDGMTRKLLGLTILCSLLGVILIS